MQLFEKNMYIKKLKKYIFERFLLSVIYIQTNFYLRLYYLSIFIYIFDVTKIFELVDVLLKISRFFISNIIQFKKCNFLVKISFF